MKYKYCPCCETEKSTADFNKNSHSKDGLQGWCKLCRRVFAAPNPKRDPVNIVNVVTIDDSLPMGFMEAIG